MTDKKKQTIKHEKRHHRWLMASWKSPRTALLAVVLLTAFGGGIYSILDSSAATRTYGSLVIGVRSSQNSLQLLNGAVINVEGFDSVTGVGRGNTCNGAPVTVVNGTANFGTCLVHTADARVLLYRITSISYSNWSPAPAGGHCSVGVGTTIVINTNAHVGVMACMTPPPPPGPPSFSTVDKTQTSLLVRWNSGGGSTEQYSLYKNGAIAVATSRSDWTLSNLTCGTNYTIGIQGVGLGMASAIVSQNYSTLACTVNVPAPQAQVQAPIVSGSTPARNTVTTSRTVARAPVTNTTPAVTANTDKQAPTAPASLTAAEGAAGSIDLSWVASTDDTAVTGYVVERSDDDGQAWSILSDNTTDVAYTDTATEFSAKYIYRVSAKDAAGNGSDYVVTDITTSSFSPNTYADQDSTIESDDGVVSVKIPEGAISEDAACEINKSTDKSLQKSGSVLAGAYELVCKTADGTQIDKFNKAIEFKLAVSPQQLKSNPKLYVNDNGKWTNSKLKLDSKHNFTFSTDSPKPFAIISASGSMGWWKILLGLFLLVGAVFGLVAWIRRRKQLSSYYDSLNTQYANPTPVVYNDYYVAPPVQPVATTNPNDPFAPQPLPPQQTTGLDQEIGHRTIFSPAIGSSPAQQPPPAVGGINDPFNVPPHSSQQLPQPVNPNDPYVDPQNPTQQK